MADTAEKLYQSAMCLGDQERAELVGLLLDSLEIESDIEAETAWLSEIERRVAELDSESVKSISWAAVRSNVFKTSGL